jgi:hypothetical protein
MTFERLFKVFENTAPRKPQGGRVACVRSSAWLLSFIMISLLIPERSSAQREMWLDYYATFPAGRFWSYEVNPGFSKGLTNPVWLDTYISGNATYQDQNWLSTEGNLEFHYTFNSGAENVFELRPWVGTNLIWATHGGFLNLFYPSFGMRFEDRFFWYQTSGTQETKQRLRFRLSVRFPLNSASLVTGTFYVITLVEGYFPLNGEAKEISADKRRFQLGMGYVVATDLRVEMQYILMRQRNTIQNTFETSSNVVWLAVRNYF